ncbi:divalent-cation tolerance protein CutA [Stenotrophomonas pigmentata]|jgi:periplasmic divalent cation tolerance protein|uniref:divalent-cation tolerance protein CutA n=1 Tax=Stenotrophomonas pigmentata TaxID=3055080 RepID=UPI0026ECBCBB|nr:divalent-cation tolerance protein CutA [Stenotrophomonas sp. 610A2]
MDVRLVFCTCPDDQTAQTLARLLVEQRLAACVNLLPAMRSVYRWQEQIEQAEEIQLVIKTCADRLDALSAAIRQHHPYELPEIVAISPSAGLPAYLDWIRAQTREET